MSKYSAIILAAGKGSRMNSDVKKQYMEIEGKPLVYYPLKAFSEASVDEIVLVVGKGEVEFAKREIVEKYAFEKVKYIVEGGSERYESVYEGLKRAAGEYVLIHDGARACISIEVINRVMDSVQRFDASIAAVPEVNTVKIVDRDGFVESTPDRNRVWAIQTPQAFKRSLLENAYKKLFLDKPSYAITDDAMVVEYAFPSKKIYIEKGSDENIKVTTKKDFEFVQSVLLTKME